MVKQEEKKEMSEDALISGSLPVCDLSVVLSVYFCECLTVSQSVCPPA